MESMMTEEQIRAYRQAVEDEKFRKLIQPGGERLYGPARHDANIRLTAMLEALDNVLYGLNHR